jgi:exosortase A-associated hydrolase 1
VSAAEEALVFECEGEQLVGVLAGASSGQSTGVLIVVGGPQYRVGSHRQFVLLARALADAGYPSLRFDYRGMGDSSGASRTFEHVESDLVAAAAVFKARLPTLSRLVIFGLCDAASAGLMSAGRIEGVAGLILANPWVRRPESHNATVVRHYYAGRLASGEFWKKLLSGHVSILRALREAGSRLRAMMRSRLSDRSVATRGDFVDQMLAAWQTFQGDCLVILSEKDLTAREFEALYRADPAWSHSRAAESAHFCTIRGADHTFSRAEHRATAEAACISFLNSLSHAA